MEFPLTSENNLHRINIRQSENWIAKILIAAACSLEIPFKTHVFVRVHGISFETIENVGNIDSTIIFSIYEQNSWNTRKQTFRIHIFIWQNFCQKLIGTLITSDTIEQ